MEVVDLWTGGCTRAKKSLKRRWIIRHRCFQWAREIIEGKANNFEAREPEGAYFDSWGFCYECLKNDGEDAQVELRNSRLDPDVVTPSRKISHPLIIEEKGWRWLFWFLVWGTW